MGLTDISNNFLALKAIKVVSRCLCGHVCLQDVFIDHNGKLLPSCRGFDSEAAAVLKHVDLIRS